MEHNSNPPNNQVSHPGIGQGLEDGLEPLRHEPQCNPTSPSNPTPSTLHTFLTDNKPTPILALPD
jgi:hypothetical protein